MRDNLIFSGIRESEGVSDQEIRSALLKLFQDDLKLTDPENIVITRCHRLHGKNRNIRDIVARFENPHDKRRILKSAHKLKDRAEPVYINEQFPREIEQKRKILRPLLKEAKKRSHKATLVQDKLIVNGRPYHVDTLMYLPFDISTLSTKLTQDHVLFGGRLSPFSNFFKMGHTFTVADITYTCSEQYYQRAKALFAGDQKAACDIQMSIDPVQMKRIGDSLKVDEEAWHEKSLLEMEIAVFSKFMQNRDLMDIMRDNGDSRTFAECNQYDTKWGTGRALDTDEADNETTWEGDNHLGRILDKVRERILA